MPRNAQTRRDILGALAGGLVLAGCSRGPSAPPPPSDTGADAAYKLAVGDRLRVAVFGHPKHTGEFQIDGGGNINFPLLGEVAAKGLTVAELRRKLTKKLGENYIVNPKLSVEVLDYRPFFILGEVNSAGQYPYTPGLTIRQAVAKAGGFTDRAAPSDIVLRRPTPEGMKVYSARLATKILPGDTIEVRRRLF